MIVITAKPGLKQRYGIDIEAYERLLKKQRGRCAICHRLPRKNAAGRRLAIDHQHGTTFIRGILCQHCNIGIGLFADDPKLLRKAALYLLRARGVK